MIIIMVVRKGLGQVIIRLAHVDNKVNVMYGNPDKSGHLSIHFFVNFLCY